MACGLSAGFSHMSIIILYLKNLRIFYYRTDSAINLRIGKLTLSHSDPDVALQQIAKARALYGYIINRLFGWRHQGPGPLL